MSEKKKLIEHLEDALTFLNKLRQMAPEEAILKLLETGPLKPDELFNQLSEPTRVPGSPVLTAMFAALDNFGGHTREDYEQAVNKLYKEGKLVIDWRTLSFSLPKQK